MKQVAIVAACICTAFATSSFAKDGKLETLADLVAISNNEVVSGLIGAVGDAYGWANTDLESRKLPPLFCVPKKLAMGNGQYVLMLSRFTEENPHFKDNDFHLYPYVLLMALKEAFPCE